jgi:agmatine/peptidylarginine deiminase
MMLFRKTFKNHLKPLPVSICLLFSACTDHNSNSRVAGHFEEFSPEALEAFRNQQEVIAEHDPSQAIVMSYTMFTEHKREDMAEAFLRTAIDTLWVVVPKTYTAKEEAADLARLYQTAGQLRSKIRLLRQPVEGKLREWARDFAPLTARTRQGGLALLDFNYYSDRPADDSVPQELAKEMGLPRISLPVYNEGGNFMNNRQGACLMTDRVLRANDQVEVEGDRILTPAEVEAYYRDFAGCKTVHIFPSMPYEGTRHIDIWGKFLDDRTIVVAEVEERVSSLSHYTAEDKLKVKEVRDYLEARTLELRNLGYDVVRVPMPAPIFASDGFNLFRSFTNSLILNGTVFIPSYEKPTNPLDGINGAYADAAFLSDYHQKVQEVHERAGYTVVWIPSDSLIAKGGAVHCTTMQIAR